ncbi:MAG: hypothetical protein C0603_04945 [Denitrovibrio sp.]|nr:MAG: hypothetical protein C0603_04945 [Denitrovibrio sp.]
MNRQQITTIVAIAGAIFLLFYWTHLIFNSGIKSADSSVKTIQTKIDKSSALAAKAKSGKRTSAFMNSGLLSFLQTTTEQIGLADKVGGIKPKPVPGAKEAATIRLEGLNYNELVSFLRSVEKYQNLYSNNVKISKRFDNNQLLNLVMDIAKK